MATCTITTWGNGWHSSALNIHSCLISKAVCFLQGVSRENHDAIALEKLNVIPYATAIDRIHASAKPTGHPHRVRHAPAAGCGIAHNTHTRTHVVGSSSRMVFGSPTVAMATLRRRFMPPL